MSKVWKALIIDDEQLARKRLARLLAKYPQVKIIGEAADGRDGIDKIETLKPDLIFLDIEMPVFNGFEMLARINHQPKVVFATAFDQYAVKAFEEDSIDYLLKPVEAERLEKTIKKLDQTRHSISDYLKLESLIQGITPKTALKTLTVKTGDKILLLKLTETVFIDAEDKYVFINTLDGKRHITDFTINGLGERLPGTFMRIHRSYIINTDYISEIRKSFNGAFVFVMNDKACTRLSSSRSYNDILRERFEI